MWHGEIDAINGLVASGVGVEGKNLVLYTTAEPCPMCQAAILLSGIETVVFGTSIRSLQRLGWRQAKKLGFEKGDTVVARVRGDDREYMLNLYLNKPLIAFSYRAAVQTEKVEWIEVKVPLDKFEATSFGRVAKDAGAVKPEEINAIGFMLSDKKAAVQDGSRVDQG